MSKDTGTIESLGGVLQGLAASEPCSREELVDWVNRSREALALTQQLSKMKIAVPELVYHYLSDADIRLKDPRYAELQIPRIREVARLMSEGVIEGADEI